MIVAAGEVLVDIFPQYQRVGGAPFNFAYHVKHLGMDVKFITRIGDDAVGADIFSMLEKNGFDTDLVQIDKTHDTGRVIVTPDSRGGHQFEILQGAAYDHIEFPDKPSDVSGGGAIELIYFGTLAQRTASGFNQLQTFLIKRDPATKCFYDINLRPGNFSNENILASLQKTDILKLNDEELDHIRAMFRLNHDDTGLSRWLIEHFAIEIVCLTKGPAGSAIITADDYNSATVPDFEIVDTVGAGDAYAAMLAVGWLKGLSFKTILSMATDFSARICRIKGAVPEDPEFYEPFLTQLSGAENA